LQGELLLIRHAQTDLAGMLCGHLDPHLNAEGSKQAAALASLLSNHAIRRLYSSDLHRALETAQPLAELSGVPVMVKSDLREISFGVWEGRRWADVKAELGPEAPSLETAPEMCVNGGERFDLFRARVESALREICNESIGQPTAVVTHMGVIRVALKYIASPEDPLLIEQRMEYCAVYRFLFNGPSLMFAGQIC
jgi:broad specificity phosphatase PhoE